MRRFVWLLFLLCACSDDVTYEAGTQITVRVQGSVAVQGADSLSIQVAPFIGGAFVAREPVLVSLSGLDWPVDLPVVPGKGQSADARFEVVVRAVVAGSPIAEARAITHFVRGEQRLLTMNLIGCGDPSICESNASCHGTQCLTCVAGRCEPTSETAGEDLPRFDPDRIPDNHPVEAADGEPGERDAAAPDCLEDETTCRDDKLFVCREGAFAFATDCANGCEDGACVRVCEQDARRCDELQPQRCDANGAWQNEGTACDVLCDEGVCKQCQGDVAQCNGNTRQICSAEGVWVDDRTCSELCTRGVCETLGSCTDLTLCGGARDSCCVSHVVPGGSFFRSFDGGEYPDSDFPARVSTFRLDKYEVTVARFRRFLAVYDTAMPPLPGSGKHPRVAEDTGWSSAWDAMLPASASELAAQLADCPETTWTEIASDHENKPINCVSWYVAQAFCTWDRGRLPTEAEWNYAAAGGAEQRLYPWSDPPTSPLVGVNYATYAPAPVADVGSTPDGDGRYGQSDLGGNVQEWVLDWHRDIYRIVPCEDCADLQAMDMRVLRGGGYGYIESALKASFRDSFFPELGLGKVGFRCAREE